MKSEQEIRDSRLQLIQDKIDLDDLMKGVNIEDEAVQIVYPVRRLREVEFGISILDWMLGEDINGGTVKATDIISFLSLRRRNQK